MATHHGRPGGRLLEAVLILLLVIFTLVFLMGVGVAAVYLVTVVWQPEDRKAGAAIYVGIFFFAVFLLKYPWIALLKYYGTEIRPLRPIKEDETNDRDAH